MTWEEHIPRKISAENRPFYTYTLVDKGGENYYAAFVVQFADGFKATTPDLGDDPMPYHFTHDTRQIILALGYNIEIEPRQLEQAS